MPLSPPKREPALFRIEFLLGGVPIDFFPEELANKDCFSFLGMDWFFGSKTIGDSNFGDSKVLPSPHSCGNRISVPGFKIPFIGSREFHWLLSLSCFFYLFFTAPLWNRSTYPPKVQHGSPENGSKRNRRFLFRFHVNFGGVFLKWFAGHIFD